MHKTMKPKVRCCCTCKWIFWAASLDNLWCPLCNSPSDAARYIFKGNTTLYRKTQAPFKKNRLRFALLGGQRAHVQIYLNLIQRHFKMKRWTQNLRLVHEEGTSNLIATCESVNAAKLIATLPTILGTAKELLEAYKIERNALISESDKFGIHENTEEYKECIDLMEELIIRSESTVQSLLLALYDCTSHRSK